MRYVPGGFLSQEESMSGHPLRYPRFCDAWEALGAGKPGQTYHKLASAYAHPMPAYHTLSRVDECILVLNVCPPDLKQNVSLPCVVAAIYFAHAVRRLGLSRTDEAYLNADFAAQCAFEAGIRQLDKIFANLVLAAWHEKTAGTPEEELIADLDLALLGDVPAKFYHDEQALGADYIPQFPDEHEYWFDRCTLLLRLVRRQGGLFHIAHFRQARGRFAELNIENSCRIHGIPLV